jgi:hypothetical protein
LEFPVCGLEGDGVILHGMSFVLQQKRLAKGNFRCLGIVKYLDEEFARARLRDL